MKCCIKLIGTGALISAILTLDVLLGVPDNYGISRDPSCIICEPEFVPFHRADAIYLIIVNSSVVFLQSLYATLHFINCESRYYHFLIMTFVSWPYILLCTTVPYNAHTMYNNLCYIEFDIQSVFCVWLFYWFHTSSCVRC